MNKPGKKAISFILSAALLLSCLPITALASESSAEENIINTANDANSGPTVIGEVTEKREANQKVFRLSDGSYMSAEYPQQVHFEENGQWNDYDNTLIEEESEETNEKELVNSASDVKVRLSKKTNGKKFVRIEKDGYKLSWCYLNDKKSTAQVTENEKPSSGKTVLDKLTSTVLYKNVYKNVDFEYVVLPTGLKENIILKNNTAQTVFEAEYKSNGLVAEQFDEKTIVLKSNGGEIIYTISAPFMEDSNGAYCENVAIKLESVKNNTFCVKINLDKDWLLREERAYPVLVDPVLKTNQDISAAQSAFVSSANPNKCYLASGTDEMGSLYVGNISGFGQTESYVKFTSLPSLGIADKVIDARVYLALRKCEIGLTVNVKQLAADWDPYTVKWNNKPYSNNIIKDYMTLTPQTDTSQFRSVEITDLVRGWYSGEYPNYGMSLSTDKTTASKAWFYSIHYTGYTAARPIMTVTYRNMSGYENYWSYTNLNAGRNGTLSVNNYNGNLTFIQPVTENTGGSLMPVELSFVYNLNGLPTQHTNLTAGYTYMGQNMQTNYHIYIREDSRTSSNGFRYFLHDGDGTRHWFYFENNSSVGKDEDGLGYTLELINANSDSICAAARYRIKDKDGNRMYFNDLGNIIQITNANNISSSVQYETVSGNLRIKSITDGAGRLYNFGYHPLYPDLLCNITDPAGRQTKFEYWTGFFTMFEFSDGKKFYISYSNGVPVNFGSIDGTNTVIRYDATAQKRVTFAGWGRDENNLVESYSFSYKQNETKITDKLGRTITYQFNDYGQKTGVISDTDGTARFFEYESGNSTSKKANKLLSESKALETVTNYAVNPGFTRNYSDGFWTYAPDSTGSPSVAIDTAKGNLTKNSLKVYKPSSNSENVMAVQNVQNLPAGTYTLSGYVNTGGTTLAGIGSYFGIEIRNSAGAMVTVKKAEPIMQNNKWERVSITFTLPENHNLTFVMGFDCYGVNSYGTVWFDDIQLEKGTGTSSFNLLENSSALNGKTSWNSEAIIGNGNNLANYPNYFYRNGDITDRWQGICQIIYANSKPGDVFVFGAWVKADSVPTNNGTRDAGTPEPAFSLALHYYNSDWSWKGCKNIDINPDLSGWQFVSGELILPQDTPKLCFDVQYYYNANKVAVTGAFCYKEEFGSSYTYDDNGNVVSVSDLAKANSEFKYYSNQAQQMITPSGSKYYYHYEPSNLQLHLALSNSGQGYAFTYDSKGNTKRTKTIAWKPVSNLESGKSYVLVNAYSGLCIDGYTKGNAGDTATTYIIGLNSIKQHWRIQNIDEANGIYTIQCAAYNDRYLNVKDGSGTHGAGFEIWPYNGGNSQKFKLVKQNDGTFAIFTACSGYTKAADGQLDAGNAIVLGKPVKQVDCNASNLKASQKWYFYPVESAEENTIITSAQYSASGNYVSSMTDALGQTVRYQYNEQNGRLESVTDPKGNVTSYTYDPNNNALLSVSSGGATVGYSYENDRLKSITSGGNSYGFNYDAFGRRTSVTVGGSTLSETAYDSAGRVSRQTYGNGRYIDFTYDNLDRITSKVYNNSSNDKAVYYYGTNGKLSHTVDFAANTHTKYIYDLAGRIVEQKVYSGTDLLGINLLSSVKYKYAEKTGKTESITYGTAVGSQDYIYTYGSIAAGTNPDAVYGVTYNGNRHIEYSYDGLGRITERKLNVPNQSYTYAYKAGGHGTDSTTTLVESVTSGGITTSYVYDQNGNITEIKRNGVTVESYTYDSLNQLKTVTRNGVTTEYTYSNGNITEVKQNGETVKSYAYGNSNWRDLLTEYNGQTITYDQIGNPLTYRGKNMTWQNGRRLAGITDENNTIAYAYDADGNRISKTVNGVTTDYVVIDGTLAGEITGDNKLAFLYDESGTKYGFMYNGATYFYNLNLQGDVVGIYDSTGAEVVNYTYDEWGKILSVTGTLAGTIGQINPIRYRGYYYDNETGFYFLQSRYYDPETGRFLNADSVISGMLESVHGYNLFAYCDNNPINKSDSTGNWPKWIKKISSAVKKAVKTISQVAKSFVNNNYYISSTTPNRRPNTGKPGSTYTAPNGDKRTYGHDGRPTKDWDHDDHGAPNKHPHDSEGGHTHDWENGKRGPAHIEQIKPILGVTLITACTLGMAFVVANDTTGIGVIDDFLISPLGSGIGSGVIMIFGQ